MILDKIVADTKLRLQEEKKNVPLEKMMEQALELGGNTGYPFRQMLEQENLQFICEVKKASPSRGLIAEEFPYVEIAREYEQAGASAISVLTEPHFFQGSPEYLKEIHEHVSLPLLRKDFTVDSYQIYEARALGASAVLLIAAVLTDEELLRFGRLAEKLGLSALVEVHDEEEVKRALQAGASILGVNNRNLKDFTVDVGNTLRLQEKVPDGIPLIAESGIKEREDIRKLEEAGVQGVLIGETFMRSQDKKAMLAYLKGQRHEGYENKD